MVNSLTSRLTTHVCLDVQEMMKEFIGVSRKSKKYCKWDLNDDGLLGTTRFCNFACAVRGWGHEDPVFLDKLTEMYVSLVGTLEVDPAYGRRDNQVFDTAMRNLWNLGWRAFLLRFENTEGLPYETVKFTIETAGAA